MVRDGEESNNERGLRHWHTGSAPDHRPLPPPLTDGEPHKVVAVGQRGVRELDLGVPLGLGQGNKAQDGVRGVGRARAGGLLGLRAPRDDAQIVAGGLPSKHAVGPREASVQNRTLVRVVEGPVCNGPGASGCVYICEAVWGCVCGGVGCILCACSRRYDRVKGYMTACKGFHHLG